MSDLRSDVSKAFDASAIRVYEMKLILAVRGQGDPEDWNWDALVHQQPLRVDGGSSVLGWESVLLRPDAYPLEDLAKRSLLSEAELLNVDDSEGKEKS